MSEVTAAGQVQDSRCGTGGNVSMYNTNQMMEMQRRREIRKRDGASVALTQSGAVRSKMQCLFCPEQNI